MKQLIHKSTVGGKGRDLLEQKTCQRPLKFFYTPVPCQNEGGAVIEPIRETMVTMQPIGELTLTIARTTSVGVMAGKNDEAARAPEPEVDLREK